MSISNIDLFLTCCFFLVIGIAIGIYIGFDICDSHLERLNKLKNDK